MSGVYGKNINFSIFGESHGAAIGGVISSLPAGKEIDFSAIDLDLKRRNHRASYSTSRAEPDTYEILSGVLDNRLTGAPLAFIIRNKDTKSSDYTQLVNLMRPGHSDYPAHVKYNGYNDVRGGGHFSGRITAPLVFAGSLARQIVAEKGITVFSHILSIGSVQSESILDNMPSEKEIEMLRNSMMPVRNEQKKQEYLEEIKRYAEDKNSIGGVIECCIMCPIPGLGNPFFNSVESELASMMFSIPAVKGIEFGKGFDITKMGGADANDQYTYVGDKVITKTNNNGGILGGITNGMPIVFRVAVKPTPSIFKAQHTVNIKTHTDQALTLKGRHDACIVPRAAAVVECAAALTMLDITEGK